MAIIIETPTLETERLILRPLKISDSPAVQKHFNNWNIIKNLLDTVPWPYPDNGAQDYIENMVMPLIKEGKVYVWSIRLKEKPKDLIGLLEYRHITDRDDNRGFWLAEPYWRKGYMTEAVARVNDFIFDDLSVERIIVCNFQGNEGSKRVKEKTGAQFMGYCEKQHHSGTIQSEVWEVTAENWRKFKKNNNT
jgi:RimJ/RimL family protein N-acetyltransferase